MSRPPRELTREEYIHITTTATGGGMWLHWSPLFIEIGSPLALGSYAARMVRCVRWNGETVWYDRDREPATTDAPWLKINENRAMEFQANCRLALSTSPASKDPT